MRISVSAQQPRASIAKSVGIVVLRRGEVPSAPELQIVGLTKSAVTARAAHVAGAAVVIAKPTSVATLGQTLRSLLLRKIPTLKFYSSLSCGPTPHAPTRATRPFSCPIRGKS